MTRSPLPPDSHYFSRWKTAKYTVGWICVLPVEFSAARRLLDEEYDANNIILGAGDQNSYVLGRIGKHNVVLNCPATGTSGELRAAKIAEHMKSSFPWIRFVLLVGIGGGVPGSKHDIRLGDVVAGTSVLPLDEGASTDHGFITAVKSLVPPLVLLTALTSLNYHLESENLAQMIEEVATHAVRGRPVYARPKIDRLYSSSFLHREGCDCLRVDPEHFTQIRRRDSRQETLVCTHRGLIGSGNSVVKDARTRDELSKRRNVLCVEMEAAGVMQFTSCLPIRGISDYADGHKNDDWQPYAALAAAVYAKELLMVMSTAQIDRCVLDVAGNVLESFVSGALRTASSRSAENSPQSAQYVMDGLTDRLQFLETLLNDPMENLGDQSRIQPEDFQKVQALHGSLTRVQEALERLGAKVDQQARVTPDYVTRAEWKQLEAQVKENTSRIESLSSTTQNTLHTTARLMEDLGGHLDNKDLNLAATLLNTAKEYTGHLTGLHKGLKLRARGTKDSQTNSPSPSPSRGPRESSQPAGAEPQSPTPSSSSSTSRYKDWPRKFMTGFRSPTPTEEKRPKITPYSGASSTQERVTRPTSLHPEGYDSPHRSGTPQPPPLQQRSPSGTQIAGSDSSRRASSSDRPREIIRSRERHNPHSQHTTGESGLSGATLSSHNLPEQLNGNSEEPEYTPPCVKDIRAKFERQGAPIPSSRK